MGHLHWCLLLFLLAPPALVHSHEYYLQAAPTHLVEKGHGLYVELQTASTEEGFLSYLFGSDCYSQAVATLHKNCKSLTADERARLAYSMSRCFLERATAEKPPGACPASRHITECTKSLSEKAFTVYTQFYTNIYSICLFVSNQNFIRQAESLTMVMFSALQQIGNNISRQQEALQGLSTGMSNIQQAQQHLAAGVQEGIQEVHKLSNQASQVQHALNTSLSLQQALAEGAQGVARDLAQLAEGEAVRAAAAMDKWEVAEAAAAALLSRQSRYEQLQAGLASASDSLVQRTAGLQSTLDTVLVYQRKSEAVMSYMLGRSCKWSDVAFYSLSALCILVFSPLLPACGPALIGGTRGAALLALACCLITERGLVTWLSHLIDLTPDGKVIVALPLPRLLMLMLSSPVLNLDPRWACRISTAALAATLMIRWRFRGSLRAARGCTRRDSDVGEALAALEEHVRVLAHQQQIILQHVCPQHVIPHHRPAGLLAFRSDREPGTLDQRHSPRTDRTNPQRNAKPVPHDRTPSAGDTPLAPTRPSSDAAGAGCGGHPEAGCPPTTPGQIMSSLTRLATPGSCTHQQQLVVPDSPHLQDSQMTDESGDADMEGIDAAGQLPPPASTTKKRTRAGSTAEAASGEEAELRGMRRTKTNKR